MKKRPLKQARRGIAMLELLGALAVGSIIMLGLAVAMDTSLENMKGQQASYYQSQIVTAASKYIAANSSTLRSSLGIPTALVPVSVAQLVAGQFLPVSIADKNVYGQTPCVLVRQPDPVNHPAQFDVLVVTTGGQKIPEGDIAAIAANAGPGGGYISASDTGNAKGASWNTSTASYRSAACAGGVALSGGVADGGHLASNLFYDGPGQLSTDLLYRNEVPGRPELNRMNTPVRMAGAALVTAGNSCLNQSGVAEAGLAVDAATRSVLTCGSNGLWSYPSQWKDPVTAFADLPFAGSMTGDVRMVTGLSRAFTYNGSQWVALAVDKDGNFNVPGTITSANMTASQTIRSQGTIQADGDIASGGTVSAQQDVTAVNTVTAFDVKATNTVRAQQGIEALAWLQAPIVHVWTVMSPGDACHYPVYDPFSQSIQIMYPMGTIAMDSSYRPLVCSPDKTMRYGNGTYNP